MRTTDRVRSTDVATTRGPRIRTPRPRRRLLSIEASRTDRQRTYLADAHR